MQRLTVLGWTEQLSNARIIGETVVEKTWQIPAHGDKGPVTIALRMPEVTITDSQGR